MTQTEYPELPPGAWVPLADPEPYATEPADLSAEAQQRRFKIDAAETARVEALLQVCRWAANDGPTDPLSDKADSGVHHVMLICAIQHDRIEDRSRRLALVTWALELMAVRWHVLPVDGRSVIIAGLLAGHTRTAGDDPWGWGGHDGMRAEIMAAATSRQRRVRAHALAIEVLGL